MLVHIVYVPTEDMRGPDTSRMGRVEDIPDEVARKMLADGSAREPTDEERAEFEAGRADEAGVTTATDTTDVPTERSTVDAPRSNGRRSNSPAADQPAPPDGTTPAL